MYEETESEWLHLICHPGLSSAAKTPEILYWQISGPTNHGSLRNFAGKLTAASLCFSDALNSLETSGSFLI